MPRPNAKWQKKYGQTRKVTLLTGMDTLDTASVKLAGGNAEALEIVKRVINNSGNMAVIRLLDMDDMGITGNLIVKTFKEWAAGDIATFISGLVDRDPTLVSFIKRG